MPTVFYGGKEGRSYDLEPSAELMVVRTHERDPLDTRVLSRSAAEAAADLEMVFRLPAAGVAVYRMRPGRDARAARDRARSRIGAAPEVDFAGRVLTDAAGIPVLYTENLFVKFRGDLGESACRQRLARRGVEVKRAIPYVANGYFACVPEGSGMAVFDTAMALLDEEHVELCHPELVREGRRRGIFPQQWHLARTVLDGREINGHVDVEGAWTVTRGEGVTIAVIDDAFDIDHEEFASPGKIVAPRDATLKSGDPRGDGEEHGTACAGVACAEGLHGACGVAPAARLLPIRLRSGLGSQDEADAFHWAAEQGADVISCSWGPEDGEWNRPDDPRHQSVQPLPDSTRLAIEWATDHGRGGRGCVMTWAAGNGGPNETMDNDGYASFERVMAVAACNVNGEQCVYSESGDALWCCFPSRDFETSINKFGIWTTDRTGLAGYNKRNRRKGDLKGNYYKSFHGTSSACPGVAGVAALVLAANPSLGWRDVREVVRKTCDKIDEAGGGYDAGGHSRRYGFGRVNAAKAVAAAVGRAPSSEPTPPPAPPAPPELVEGLTRGAAPRAARASAARRIAAPRTAAPRTAPRVEVAVVFETDAPDHWVRIDDRPLHFSSGAARINLELGETYVLSWWVRGPSRTPYRITLDAGAHATFGGLPVEATIPRDGTKSAGTRKFRIEAPKNDYSQ